MNTPRLSRSAERRWSDHELDKRELLEAAVRYRRELEAQVGGHYAALAGVEADRFVEWLDRGRGMAGVLGPPVELPGAGGGSAGRVPPQLAAVVEA